jgi:mono/diheme cytochrome c family protein
MLKVLAAALIGTVAGVAVMVILIVWTGTTTPDASSIGLGTSAVTTAGGATSTPATSGSSGTGGSTSSGGGNAANGKSVFAANSCSTCHTFTAAAATGTIGPNLDGLTADAQKAGKPLDAFIHESIVDPNAYIAPGYQPSIMPQTFGTTLSASDIADLVAFLSQNQK